MTNLDSMLERRDITLPTKVHLVKAMVFPVVMYGCESWTIKKAKHQKNDAFELWCWRRLLREMSITLDTQMIPPKGRRQTGTKEPFDEDERESGKSWLKTQHSKN